MKFSKAYLRARFQKIPALRFEGQELTSFAGLVLFQALFMRLRFNARLKRCFAHLNSSSSYGIHGIVLVLVVQLIMGFKRLQDTRYYQGDPMVLRLVGLREAPSASTISRALADVDGQCVHKVRLLSTELVLGRLEREDFDRLTLDFDGSVLSTKRRAQGTAVGFNKKKKGARSYYPLFCTVAQTGQFFDRHHRPGNVHDSNGAIDFMRACIHTVRTRIPMAQLESRMDNAFFSQDILPVLDAEGVEFTSSVPFERLAELKEMVETRERWRRIDGEWSYFEKDWKPLSWKQGHRFIFVRRQVARQRKGPLQLDLFEPRDFAYDYKVIVTNKRDSAKAVIEFHNGRGAQEAIFGDAKQDAALEVIPARRLHANQMYTLCAMMAHNLTREMQMLAKPRRQETNTAKRAAAWTFETLDTLRHRIIQRAGRFNRPQGELTLTMSANKAVRKDLLHFLDRIQNAA